MASKEQQVMKNVAVKNDEKDEARKASQQSEEESHSLDKVENKKPGGNVRRGRVRRLVPNFLWAIPNRHVNHNEAGEGVGKFVGQVMESKRKTKEQQMRPYGRLQTPEPDNHYDFCLIP
ncbi:protein BEX4 [Mesocricetus auratus]|uniref:Protein BEX4 n=1 Tax=Mesocricetus auratus TaxID=10036 RepID=A0A1U7QDG6_MESAU|nr:protein BEX4 [Mesocricetus auratus]